MTRDAAYYDALMMQLDQGPFEFTTLEADFLESLLDTPGMLTERQTAVLDDMAKKYGVAEERTRG